MKRMFLLLLLLGLVGVLGFSGQRWWNAEGRSEPVPIPATAYGAEAETAAIAAPAAAATAGHEGPAAIAVERASLSVDEHLGSAVSAAVSDPVPSEDSLIVNGNALDSSAVGGVIGDDSIDGFMRRLESDAGPVATALAFEYRNGVMATLPPGGARLRNLACGTRLCVLDAWFPDQASLDAWADNDFGRGGLPRGVTQIAFSTIDQGGRRYRSIFAIDGRVNTVVMPPRVPRG